MPDSPTPDGPAPDRRIPPWFERVARLSWGFVGIAAATAVLIYGLNALRELVIPLILASFFAVVCSPGVGWLERRRVPRSIGALILIVVIGAVIVASMAVVVYGVVDQVDELTEQFDQAQDEIEDIFEQSDVNELIERIRANAGDGGAAVRDGVGSRIGTFLDSAGGFVSGLVLGVVLLYYLLKDGATIVSRAVISRKPQSTAQNQRIVEQAAGSIRGYFRGKTMLAFVQGLFVWIVLAIMGVPLSGSVGVVNFIGAYIPFLGAFIGGAFAMLMAVSEGGLGLALAALGVVLFMNIVLENVLEPRLLGSSLDMHPIVVLLSTVAGGVLAGIVGLILAAPLTAIGINLFHELQLSGFFADDTGDVTAEDADGEAAAT